MRVLGVDPGTKTFDVVVVEDGVVKAERSIETAEIAKNPSTLTNVIDSLEPDIVVAPSGYGVPVTRGDEVYDPRRFAVEVLLLSTEDDIRRGVEAGEIGIWVYDALAKAVEHIVKRYREKAVFLPAVIHLQTVPWYRKINRVDMGTVDKLASTALAIYTYSVSQGIDIEKVNIVVAEMGFGYNAAISVEKGKIVDGVGGTAASIGTLTAGSMDLEIVSHVSSWDRWDVFHGGIFDYTNIYSLDEFAKAFEKGEEPLASLFRAFVEGVAKDIKRALVSTPKAEAVVLTGRHSKNPVVKRVLQEILKDIEVVYAKPLKGASISKEAGQGYAVIGEGLFGGFFKDLVKHIEIERACGTAVDYIVHGKAKRFVERVKKAYIETVKNPRLCRENVFGG